MGRGRRNGIQEARKGGEDVVLLDYKIAMWGSWSALRKNLHLLLGSPLIIPHNSYELLHFLLNGIKFKAIGRDTRGGGGS